MAKNLKLLVVTLLFATLLGAPLQLTAVAAAQAPVAGATTRQTRLQQAEQKTKSSWPWYVARAAGLLAAVLLLLMVMMGIGLVTGYTYRFMEPLTAWAVHRAIGISFGILVLVHVGALLFDKFTPFTLWQVLVPFASHFHTVRIGRFNLGSLYIAMGVLALYAAAAIIISSLVWMDRRPKSWRLLHYLGYMLVILVFVHAVYLGTDLKNGLLRWLWYFGGLLLAVGIVNRLRRARTISRESS